MTPTSYKPTEIQKKAVDLLKTAAKHVLLVGGSRSGKTFIALRSVIVRAMAAPGSRHAVLRFRFNACKASVVLDTLPKVISICWPGMPYTLDKTDWYMTLPNGSQIWFGGLDDKERTEKILGMEFVTIYLNECSQIPWSSRTMAMSRLAQRVKITDGSKDLKLLVLYDENPPGKAHWTYKLFIRKVDPETNKPLSNPEDYAHLFMNPADNMENLPPDYLRELANMPLRMRQRFLEGKFAETVAGALWTDTLIEKQRHVDETPELIRVVVSVDPSGSGDEDNAGNDEIGIIVGALGIDGRGYILEDTTVKGSPAVWGRVGVTTYERHLADLIVAEKNFGGEMVRHTLKTVPGAESIKIKLINASRGKAIRAEPVSALTEQGKIRFAGYFPELEDELCGFTTNGYTGERSPNRADAMVHCMNELFPGLIPRAEKPKQIIREFKPMDRSMGY